MGRLQRKKNQQKTKDKKKKFVNTGKNKLIAEFSRDKKQKLSGNVIGKARSIKNKINPFSNIFTFFKESKSELKKVVWPTRKQTLGSTLVVIVIVGLVSSFLGIIDAGLSSVIRIFLG